jgi:iron complex outermembrane receptor protein
MSWSNQICTAIALALGTSSAAFAQSTETASDAGILEAVIVTAQKRSQSLQDVPLAVTAFSTEALEKSRIESLESVAVRTPNFVIGHDGPTTPELTIRGIGSTDREAGSERSVVLFVDEVYIGRTGASTFDMFDLERIEVLRGPQGSLFGRNVVGGAVHLIRAKPQNESTQRVQASIGNYGLLEARAVVNEPLTDSLWARVSISGGKQEGQYFNRVFQKRSNDSEKASFRGQLRYRPDETFDGTLTLEAAVDSMDGMASSITQGAATDADFRAALDPYGWLPHPDPYVTDNRKFGELDRENYSVSGRFEWFGDATTVTFVPAYRYTHYDELRDVSGVGFSGSGPNTRGFESTEIVDETYRAASAELRLSSATSTPLSWVVGLYFLDEQVDRDQIRERQANTTVSRPIFEQSNGTTSYAMFGNVRWETSWGLGFAVGARYTIDEKDFELDVRDTLTPRTAVPLR